MQPGSKSRLLWKGWGSADGRGIGQGVNHTLQAASHSSWTVVARVSPSPVTAMLGCSTEAALRATLGVEGHRVTWAGVGRAAVGAWAGPRVRAGAKMKLKPLEVSCHNKVSCYSFSHSSAPAVPPGAGLGHMWQKPWGTCVLRALPGRQNCFVANPFNITEGGRLCKPSVILVYLNARSYIQL